MVLYLSVQQVLELHQIQLRHYGGGEGIRDSGALEAACARPQMTFGGEDLYREFPDKAAALMYSLVMNHPFVDGNKRVGAHAALIFLMANGWDIQASPVELENVTLALAQVVMDLESLTIWWRQRSKASQ